MIKFGLIYQKIEIYNENLANEVADRIIKDYVNAIGELVENLEKLL